MAKVEHFEIPADDVDRAQSFYGTVFGYTYEPWGADEGMLRPGDGGIGGDIHKRADAPHPTVVFTVDNLEETIALVVAHGGSQFSEIKNLDERSRWAYVKDSEGNIVGIFDTTD